jgi:LacI family transcriptional regulator, galactose operon repressor
VRITQKDIARDLGVSLITVSRALNKTGYVSKELRKRILDYARNKDYVPHKASQVLVRNRFHRIALFSSTLPAYFWSEIRKGVSVAAEQIRPFNYDVRYHTIPESDPATFMKTLTEEIESGVNALAFVNQRMYDMQAVFALADRAGIPYVTFNVDAPECNRACYIGSNYEASGRLAGDFIGKALQFVPKARALAITTTEPATQYSDAPDINGERLKGFRSVLESSMPHVDCEVARITTKLQPSEVDSQIEDLLRERQGNVHAVYLVAALNSTFLDALTSLQYRKTITVLHDIDSSAMNHLETHSLSAVIYQNPVLQGYYTVKTLEYLLETKEPPDLQDVEIISNVILAENRYLFQNDYAFIG